MGLNNPHTPSEMGESRLDKKWLGICRVLRPICDFFKSKSLLQKMFGNLSRVSRSKIDICEWDLKNKWPKQKLIVKTRKNNQINTS